MPRYHPFALLTVLLLVMVGCTPGPTHTIVPPTAVPPTATPPQVLVIAREGSEDMELMLTKEVSVMIGLLEKAGFKVVVASPSGKPIVGGSATLAPHLKLSEVKVEDYTGFILPCMAAGLKAESVAIPPEAVEIVKKAVAQGKPVGAQQSAVLILAKAGVLDGKQFAVAAQFQLRVPEGIYKGTGVVQDGRIVTSGSCPYQALVGAQDTTIELTEKFIALVASVR